MKNFPLIAMLFISSFIFNACSKDISEPEHKADGSNVIYLKVDDSEEFLLDSRSKLFHKNTASNIDDPEESSVPRYTEYNRNNKVISTFTIVFNAKKANKAEFQSGYIKLKFDKSTKVLDSAFVSDRISKKSFTAIDFTIKGENPRKLYVDSLIDYKLTKWDQESKIFTFSANCNYNTGNSQQLPKKKLYFYLDIKY